MWHENILGTIGRTPLVKVNRVAVGLPGTVLAKLELFNPGSSVKDRIGVTMVDAAEKDGTLRPGGTIIEGTSGNTGTGLALVAIARGYKCIFTTTDKQSPEKLAVLRALGAEVVVCPTNVHPKDPRSYYMVARRLATEIPNSLYINQYDNPANWPAHYQGTGPEIWNDTDGRVTHFVAGAGTGGTLSGTARYLKEKNPKIKVIGVDPFGSVYFKYWRTREFDEKEIYPYITEGVGEDILAGNMDFDLVDDYVRVTDRDSMLMTRHLAREEGMFVGGSCGMAMAGALQWMQEHRSELKPADMVVVLLPDSGFRYLNKIFNDRWMQDRGFIERAPEMTAEHVLSARARSKDLISVPHDATVSDAIATLTKNDVSQAPVMKEGEPVGSLTESALLSLLIANPASKARLVSDVMGEPFPLVEPGTPVSDIGAQLESKRGAVLVRSAAGRLEILTKTDLISALAAK